MLGKALICAAVCISAVSADLLIRDAAIVDVSTGSIQRGRWILIRGDRIARIGTGITAARGVQVVNAGGKFVIPGLWDMHVHLSRREYLPLYPAHGITGVRDMGSDFDQVKVWRDQIQNGTMIGPHVETCGSPVDGFPSANPKLPVRVVQGPIEARDLYDSLEDERVDFIGVRAGLPRDAYFALIERARKYFSPVAGAIPATVSALEAVDSRQRSIEHLSGILLACSTEEEKLRARRALALERHDGGELRAIQSQALQSFSPDKAAALFSRMANYDTRLVPILLGRRSRSSESSDYEKVAGLALAMLRSGVGIMAGTDDGLDGNQPGDQLPQELALLVAAGFTPAEALRSATLEPARYLDATEALGTIEPGKIADLVLLGGNPLADIRNIREISSVVVGGKLFTSERLQKFQRAH